MVDYGLLNEAVKQRIEAIVGEGVKVGFTEPSTLTFPYVRVARAQKDKEPEAIGIGGIYMEGIVYVVSIYTWAEGGKTQDEIEDEAYEIVKKITQGITGNRKVAYDGVMNSEVETVKRAKQKKGIFRVDMEVVIYIETQGGQDGL